MKVFVSWSGERSQLLAQALREWLPLVLHYVEPWLSESDVAAGDRWAQVIAQELEASNFGIVCVTPENAGSPWLLFESGALAKSMQESRVIPLLFNLEFSDISGPLAQFQAKKVDRTGLVEVIRSINKGPEQVVRDEQANQLFDALWPKFETLLDAIPSVAPTEKHMRPQHEIIEELVTGVRALDSRFRDLETAVSDQNGSSRRRRPMRFHPMMFEELAGMGSDEPNDPLALLMMAGMLRDDMPWIAEVMVEVYREVRAGDEKSSRAAIQRLHGLTRSMRRGPWMEELTMSSSRDVHMMMMELPQFIEHVLHRYEARIDSGSEDISVKAEQPLGDDSPRRRAGRVRPGALDP